MKISILGIALALACFSSVIFALDLSALKDVSQVRVQAQVNVKTPSLKEIVKIDAAQLDKKNPSIVQFGKLDGQNFVEAARAEFHNPTEADWFLQFLVQAEPSFTLNMLLTGSNIRVDNYRVSVKSQQEFTILVKPAGPGDVISDCGDNSTPTVLIKPTDKGGLSLDDFADNFRFGLEDKGYWFGKEGKEDRAKKTKSSKGKFSCPK